MIAAHEGRARERSSVQCEPCYSHCLRTVRYDSYHVNRHSAGTSLLSRSRDRCVTRVVHLVRPQALRAAERRQLLAVPAHAAVCRAQAPRRRGPAGGDAGGERAPPPPLRDHRRRAASCSASGSPSRSRPRRSTATSGCSSSSSPSSAEPRGRCTRSRASRPSAQRAQLAELRGASIERFAGRPELAHARAPRSSSAPASPAPPPSSGRTWLGNRMARATGATVGDGAADPEVVWLLILRRGGAARRAVGVLVGAGPDRRYWRCSGGPRGSCGRGGSNRFRSASELTSSSAWARISWRSAESASITTMS